MVDDAIRMDGKSSHMQADSELSSKDLGDNCIKLEAMLKSPLVHSEILWTWNVVEYSQALLLFLVSPCLDHIISWLPLGTDVDILSSLLCRMDYLVDVS